MLRWPIFIRDLNVNHNFFVTGHENNERTYRPQRTQILFDASLGASLAQVRAIVETVAG